MRVPQAPLWRALLETGGRYGELTRLTWRDVDLDGALLRLPEEITKSGKPRAIPLLPALVGELRALLPIHERVLGRVVLGSDRVFLSPAGKQYSWATTNLKRQFARLLARAGIPRDDDQGRRVDVHSLRHSFASRLARGRVGLVQAQRLLGHSDPRPTAKTYTHLDVEDLRGAVEAIGGGASAGQQRRVQGGAGRLPGGPRAPSAAVGKRGRGGARRRAGFGTGTPGTPGTPADAHEGGRPARWDETRMGTWPATWPRETVA